MKTHAAAMALGLLGIAILASGCASTVRFKVGYDDLKPAPSKREGTLAIQTLADLRSGVTNAMQIGGKWKEAKPVYIAAQERPVAEIVTDALQDALTNTGYTVTLSRQPSAVILEGDLLEFWLSDDWGGAICKIAVHLRLKDGEGGAVLWETRLRAEEDDWAIIPNAMRASMETLLRKAMEEFAATTFVDAVNRRAPIR